MVRCVCRRGVERCVVCVIGRTGVNVKVRRAARTSYVRVDFRSAFYNSRLVCLALAATRTTALTVCSFYTKARFPLPELTARVDG